MTDTRKHGVDQENPEVLKFTDKDLWADCREGEGSRLVAYSDANYPSDESDRCSIPRGAIMCARTCVSWFSRTQRCVMTSSTGVEYVAMGDCVKESLFI